jgi:single-stranded-DNA-specific exonuclease
MSPDRLDALLQILLEERGIAPQNAEEFFSPDYKKLHDPLMLPNMEKARDRVISAIHNKEHIVVFSDYDADGIPGAVVLSDFFRRAQYDNISFYIPHRHDEGFGLNMEAIDVCVEKGAKLLITVDCGITDVAEVAYLNSHGVDVIITDHHEPGAVLPEAFAIVDPKLAPPASELCGAAVAYKLMQAILMKESFGIKPGMEKWSLDMVGIATLSDMVPLVGENRILASYGLQVLQKSPRPGLQALLNKLGIDQRYLTEDDVAFMITPRINAASRMGKPEDAFKLLSTDNMLEAEKLAAHLEKINNERKGVVASMVKEAKAHLVLRQDIGDVIVLGNPEWRPSLLGLVANSMVEEYKRPVFVWGRDGDGVLKGSCRSFDGINLHSLMEKASDCFIEYGGHSGAGGFSITLENIASLESVLSLKVKELEKNKERELQSIALELSHVGHRLWDMVSRFAPFGMNNPKPLLKLEQAEIKSAKNFGKTNNHLEIIFITPDHKEVKAICFFKTIEDVSVSLTRGSKISLLAHLEKSYFRNRPEIRLRIIEIGL